MNPTLESFTGNKSTKGTTKPRARIEQTRQSAQEPKEDPRPPGLMEYCSRFEECAAPLCPLDPDINLHDELEDDPRCTMAPATRHHYWSCLPPGSRAKLPFEGYFEAEFSRRKAARARWDSLTPEEQERRRAHLRQGSRLPTPPIKGSRPGKKPSNGGETGK